MKLVERITLRSADVDGATLWQMGSTALGLWGGSDYSLCPDSQGLSEATFDRRGLSIQKAARALQRFGPYWQVVVTYRVADE